MEPAREPDGLLNLLKKADIMQAQCAAAAAEHESIKWLLEALGDELVEVHGDPTDEGAEWKRVVTDSRAVGAGDVFVAISGERTDGHKYLAQAAASGALCAVVEHAAPGLELPQIVVENSRRAYGLIACAWRRRFSIPVTAVGGMKLNRPLACKPPATITSDLARAAFALFAKSQVAGLRNRQAKWVVSGGLPMS